jgi:iron complex transport system substrate-binding protein
MNMLNRWKELTILMVLSIALLLSGCSAEDKSSSKKEEKTDFSVNMKDAVGNEVKLDHKPKRIVSLLPSNTEILYKLGVGDTVVGVSDFDNYPKEVASKDKIGGMEFNLEKIISLKPDLVLDHGSRHHQEDALMGKLKDAGIPVYVVKEATKINDIYDTIEEIGKLTGTEQKAKNEVKEEQKSMAKIEEIGKNISPDKQKSIWIEVSPSPELYTAGKGTFIDEGLSLIGAKNVAGNTEGWPLITEEAAIQNNPDVIITTYGSDAPKKVMERKGWQNVKAVQDKQVIDVNSDKLTRPGPRIVEGIEELAKAVYPEEYKNK